MSTSYQGADKQAGRLPVSLAPGAGILATAALAWVAQQLGQMVPLVGGAVFALVIGAALRNALAIPSWLSEGAAFATKRLLKLAIILLGSTLSLKQVFAIGYQSLLVIVATIVLAMAFTEVIGRRMRLPEKLCSLIGVGTAICGATAIASIAPIIRSDDQDTAYAISTIFFFNVLAVVVYPLLGHALHLNDLLFGVWAGTAIHDTSSVLAGAYAFSDTAGQYATVVKLTRTTLLIPVAVFMALLHSWKGMQATGGAAAVPSVHIVRIFPWFILGFLAMAMANTAGLLPEATTTSLGALAKFFILMAMIGVGLGADLHKILRVGVKPLLLGLWASIIIAVVSLALSFLLLSM